MEDKDMTYNIAFFYTKMGLFEELENMLKSGFDINTTNVVGQNLLLQMFCVPMKTRQQGILKLIELGIDVNFIDDANQTALYCASFANMTAVVVQLLQRAADPTLGENILPHFLGEDKTTIRSILLTSPLLTPVQKTWLETNQKLEW